jgi:hypothetical protein
MTITGIRIFPKRAPALRLVSASIADFERLTKDDYRDILYKNGFIRDISQRRLF